MLPEQGGAGAAPVGRWRGTAFSRLGNLFPSAFPSAACGRFRVMFARRCLRKRCERDISADDLSQVRRAGPRRAGGVLARVRAEGQGAGMAAATRDGSGSAELNACAAGG